MRNIFILASAILQLFVLIYMAGYRELIIHTGKTVFLRTMPVDPRDPFRGDYVSLNYEISEISKKFLKGRILSGKDDKYYTVLKKGEKGLYELDYCTSERPSGNEVFIKGRYAYSWRWEPSSKNLSLKYGIEKYFVQQKKGLEIEKRAGAGNEIHVPLEVEVALGSDGTAVAKGYRWSQLGIGLQITENPTRQTGWQDGRTRAAQVNPDAKERKSPKIKLTLENVSDKPIALVDLPDFRSFSVVPAENSARDWTFSKKFDSSVRPSNENVIILKPDEKTSFDFDFAEPRWFVNGKTGPEEIGVACDQWGDMFRIIYNPPSVEDCKTLDRRDIIWHGKLPSRRFSVGRID
ncbi:MAG: GDYXXLXY domain-containing protein [Victivallales bacterium]